MPIVSVVLNCYNGERYLRETLESIKNQTYEDFELIFWDNGSTDSTPEIAHTFDKRLKYYRGETTIPLGAARNEALKKITGDYVAFIDADDLWEPTKIEKQVAILDENTDCGMVCTNHVSFNMITGRRTIFESDAKKKILEFSEFANNYNYRLSSFMLRKKAMDGLEHYFDNRFKYVEEYDMFLRIAYSWKTVYLPDVLVTYRIHRAMNTFIVSDDIPAEYDKLIDKLLVVDPRIENEYPEVMKWIRYSRDLFIIKKCAFNGENNKVRELANQYLDYNIRAKSFFIIACFPSIISKNIVRLFYKSRI